MTLTEARERIALLERERDAWLASYQLAASVATTYEDNLTKAEATLRFYADNNYGPVTSDRQWIAQDCGSRARAYFANKETP